MTTVAAPATTDIAAVLDLAADHITTVGYCKKYLYNTRQAETGLPLDKCSVDLIGAINAAVHGTPRHVGGDPLTFAAEQALTERVDAPSLATWCDYPGSGKTTALALLRDTAEALRAEA
ncbi:hypothetical protein ABZX82_01710 [Streptomyces griseoflavus]|uniref:DUF6197 family protein n=1 Tax=Streptomyces griseoflavus TaxID=35619 RepID=UPI0033BB29F3